MLFRSAGRPFAHPWSTLLPVFCSGFSLVLSFTTPNSHAPLPGPNLDPRTLSKVRKRLDSVASDVWVSGTQAEAYLEFDYPQLTVFDPDVFQTLPPDCSSTGDTSAQLASSRRSYYPRSSNRIILAWLKKRQPGDHQFAEIKGGAAGDPASLGYAWIVAQATAKHRGTRNRLEKALEEEVEYLLKEVPRTEDGAISHREEVTQLWSDFIYMAPPLLAARGSIKADHSLLLESYKQIKLYRSHLQDPSTRLWSHIRYGTWNDSSLWATGNAWVTAGITRVLATLLHSGHAEMYKGEIRDLARWANEIVEAAFARVNEEGLLPNHFSQPNDFSDSSSSTLLAATVYRLDQLGVLENSSSKLNQADQIRCKVYDKIDEETGWLTGCVDPLHWDQRTDQSPEAQAFIILLEAAWRDHRSMLDRTWTSRKSRSRSRSKPS